MLVCGSKSSGYCIYIEYTHLPCPMVSFYTLYFHYATYIRTYVHMSLPVPSSETTGPAVHAGLLELTLQGLALLYVGVISLVRVVVAVVVAVVLAVMIVEDDPVVHT